MLMIRPNVPSPTGTLIGAPVPSTSWPRVRLGYDRGYGGGRGAVHGRMGDRGDPDYNRGPPPSRGYERSGYGRGGYERGGYDRGGYERGGYDRGGYDRGGYERGGHDRDGYDR